VADAHGPDEWLGGEDRLQFPDLALGPSPFDPGRARRSRYAGRVIAAIFQPLEAVDDARAHRRQAHDADDAAHGPSLPFAAQEAP